MPYNCEECGNLGARMNTILEIRLCETCSHSYKYKLICKSQGFKKYLLTEIDLNGQNQIQLVQYHCKNPHWKSGPAMTLYLESELAQVFLNKYNDVITNRLNILEPILDIDDTLSQVSDWLKDSKNKVKQDKYDKILKKLDIELENLPGWVRDNLKQAKSGAEFERVLSSYIRFKKLYGILKLEGLVKYIDHSICHDYIYQKYEANL